MDIKKQPQKSDTKDVKTPASTPSAYEQSVRSDLKPEVAERIPVKQQSGAPSTLDDMTGNPIKGGQNTGNPEGGSEAEMDKLLEDVNKKVKSANAEQGSKSGWFSWLKKSPPPPPGARTSHRSAKPVVVAVVAILAGLTLAAVAYFAFRQEESLKQSAASNQSVAEDTSVTPADIDSLSSDMQSEVDNLDSSQDFNSASLNDATLGL